MYFFILCLTESRFIDLIFKPILNLFLFGFFYSLFIKIDRFINSLAPEFIKGLKHAENVRELFIIS